MVLAHLRFALILYHKKVIPGCSLAQADLIQEANVGLMKSRETFQRNGRSPPVTTSPFTGSGESHRDYLHSLDRQVATTKKRQRKPASSLRSRKEAP